MRILIADDSIVSRHLLEATLRKWGYEVVVATDGVEALNALQGENPPRLAVLDWVMPGLTGPEVCSRAPVRRLVTHKRHAASRCCDHLVGIGKRPCLLRQPSFPEAICESFPPKKENADSKTAAGHRPIEHAIQTWSGRKLCRSPDTSA